MLKIENWNPNENVYNTNISDATKWKLQVNEVPVQPFAIIFKVFFNFYFYVLLLQKHPIYMYMYSFTPQKLAPNFHLLFYFNRNSEARIRKLKTSLTNLEHWCGMLTPWWLLNQADIPLTACLNTTMNNNRENKTIYILKLKMLHRIPVLVVSLSHNAPMSRCVTDSAKLFCRGWEKLNWFQNYMLMYTELDTPIFN